MQWRWYLTGVGIESEEHSNSPSSSPSKVVVSRQGVERNCYSLTNRWKPAVDDWERLTGKETARPWLTNETSPISLGDLKNGFRMVDLLRIDP